MNDNSTKNATTIAFIAEASHKHNYKYDYSKTIYNGALIPVIITCPVHGDFLQTPHDHLSRNDNGEFKGCKKCGMDKSSQKRTKSTEEFIRQAKEVHGNKYDYSKTVYKKARDYVTITCKKHGDFLQTPDNHLRGRNCPFCRQQNYEQTNLERYGVKYPNQSREILEKTSERNFEKYGVFHPMQLKETIDKMKKTNLERYGVELPLQADSIFDKFTETSINKYGVNHPMKVDKIKNRCVANLKASNLEKYGVEWPVQSQQEKEKIINKMIETNREKFGTDWPSQAMTPKEKMYATKRKNGTFNSSKPEDNLYIILVDRFGKEDIERNNNKHKEYPFAVDFYIKSRDLYLEYNGSWLHGSHFFNEDDPFDLQRLETLKSKKTKYYDNAIKTWTIRDVIKRKTAKQNNLNYVTLWNPQDIKEWFALSCPDGQDYDFEYSWKIYFFYIFYCFFVFSVL